MKNKFLVAALIGYLMTTGISRAQIEKGNFLIGGSTALSSTKVAGGRVKSASFSPDVAYFFTKRLAAGVSMSLSTSRTFNDAGTVLEITNTIAAGPIARYYFPVGTRWAIFPDMEAAYGSTTSHSKVPSTTSTPDKTVNAAIWRGGVGVTTFISKSVGVEGLLYYQTYHETYSYNNETSSEDGFNFRIALQVYINKHQ